MTDRRITAHDVQPAADGTTATEFEWNVPERGGYWFDLSTWTLYGPVEAGAERAQWTAINPTRPRPDWEPPEWLLPGFIAKDGHGWWWYSNEPYYENGKWDHEGQAFQLTGFPLDTSNWPDVEPEHSLYECLGRQQSLASGMAGEMFGCYERQQEQERRDEGHD